MIKLVFATNNAHKLEEARSILGGLVEVVSLSDIGCNDDIPETGTTLDANSLQKAEFINNKYSVNCFADDTGLEIDALNGTPGVYTARYAGEPKNDANNRHKVLQELSDTTTRSAHFRTIITLIIDRVTIQFDGRVNGTITTEERGDSGFGYDPIFQPDGYDKTFAQLPAKVKNSISHRSEALRKMKEYLTNQH